MPGIVPIPILQDLPQQTALVEVRIKFIDPPEKTLNISPDRNVFGRMDKISLDLVLFDNHAGRSPFDQKIRHRIERRRIDAQGELEP